MRGWWLAWSSPEPRRSGAFIVEIVERASRIKNPLNIPNPRNLLPTMSLNQIGAVGTDGLFEKMGAINTKTPTHQSTINGGNDNRFGGQSLATTQTTTHHHDHHDKDTGLLNVGDVFRLRSIKFPDYELGLTSERLRDDFYYLGLRKTSDKDSDNWCSTLHFSLSTSSGVVF